MRFVFVVLVEYSAVKMTIDYTSCFHEDCVACSRSGTQHEEVDSEKTPETEELACKETPGLGKGSQALDCGRLDALLLE